MNAWRFLARSPAWSSITAIFGPANTHAARKRALRTRPCAIVLASTDDADGPTVTVLPVTHTPPSDPRLTVEIPAATKRRLGLDDTRSWIVLTEANRFTWPGPDLRPSRSGDAARVAYGQLPYALFEEVRQKLLAALKSRATRIVPRTE